MKTDCRIAEGSEEYNPKKGRVKKVKTTIKRLTALIITLLLVGNTMLLSSCAPKLEEVKDEFIRLIKESYAVNELLFGDGLSGYGILEYDEASGVYYSNYYTVDHGRLCAYRDKSLGKYVVLSVRETETDGWVYKNETRGWYYYPTDLEYSEGPRTLPDTPYGYRHVRADERFTTINQLSAYAATVYSEDYLADLFTILFDSGATVDYESDTPPKYLEMTDSESGQVYLLCADKKTCPPIDDGKRIYDYDSITIAKRSRRAYVNVEIRAYGKYADTASGEVVVGWHTVKLSFVNQNGEWRLDSPTY